MMAQFADFEALLAATLARRLGSHLSANVVPAKLSESIRYSLLAPGKRIRPRLVLESGAMLGLRREQCLPLAMAIEMIHCFTLIHDDLPCMDDDDYRRGQLSNHKKFGESVALLAGDALVIIAIETLVDIEGLVPAPCLLKALGRLLWAAGPRGVIGGQAAEFELSGSGSDSGSDGDSDSDKNDAALERLMHVHKLKTGALFRAAILMPADLAALESTDPRMKGLETFADALGLAFQIADDIDDDDSDSDGDSGNGKSYTNILYYIARKDACKLAVAGLSAASKGLSVLWGDEAAGLISIADEVLRKFKV